MNEAQAVTTHVSSNHIDLAIAGWFDAHSRLAKTLKAYTDTINQFRDELRCIWHDLESDTCAIAMVVQRLASLSTNQLVHKVTS